jgi:hypothetical protein
VPSPVCEPKCLGCSTPFLQLTLVTNVRNIFKILGCHEKETTQKSTSKAKITSSEGCATDKEQAHLTGSPLGFYL